MKVYVIGHRGWIGSQFIQLLKQFNISMILSQFRVENKKIYEDILQSSATHIFCCIGRTHGTFKGKYYPTIDYLEHNDTLSINLNDNLYSPLSLAMFCDKNNLHFTYIGTGCIFEYDQNHTQLNKNGFNEDDNANFFGSNYSIVKGFTDRLMKQTNALNLRIRMPIISKNNPRNFITKIINYEKICSMPNSMSVLDELLPVAIEMMKNNEKGTFNFTNEGTISHNEILEMYKNIVDPSFTWKNFTIEEQDKILLGKRSNNYLNTNKLYSKYGHLITNIHNAIRKCLLNWEK